MEDNIDEVFEAYCDETDTLLAETILNLQHIKDSNLSEDPCLNITRCVHTIKGNSKLVGQDSIYDLMVVYEKAFHSIRDSKKNPSNEAITMLLEIASQIKASIPKAKLGEVLKINEHSSWINKLKSTL